MDKTLRLQVLFGAINKLSAPLRDMTGSSKKAAAAIAATKKEVLGLERASGKIGKFRELERAGAKTAEQLGYARARVDALKTAISEATGPTGRLSAQLVVAEGRVAKLEGTTESQTEKLDRLGRELRDAGIDTGKLADEERRLARDTDAANKRLGEQETRAARAAKIRAIGARTSAVGGRIADAGRQASLTVTTPIVALGALSGRAYMGFADQMASVSTLVDESTESMGRMKAEVLDLSKRVPVQLQDLTGSLYNIRSAGVGAGQAMGVLEGSARLAVAGLGTTDQAADIATSAINAFGLKGKEANAIYDTVFKGVKYGKTTIDQLSQGFGGVAGTVANAGVKFDEFVASTAALTTTGQPAAQAYTQIRAAIAGLTRDTKQSKAVFGALGATSFKDLVAKSGGMVNAFSRIRTQLKGNDAAMLELVGSTEALNAMVGLTGNQNGTFKQALGDMRGGANALDPAYDKKAKDDAAKLQITKNKLQIAAIQIGAIVVPVISRLGEIAGKAADAFERLSPETQRTIVTLLALAAGAGPVMMVVGNVTRVIGFLIPIMMRLAPILGMVTSGFVRMSIAMMMNPWVAAIAGLIALGVAIYTHWDKIKSFLSGLVPFFKQVGGLMMEGLLSMLNPARLVANVVKMGKSAIGAFKNVLGIHSPSRVFAELGGHMMGGLALGLDRSAREPLARVRAAGSAVAKAGAVSLAMASPVAAASGSSSPAPAKPGTGTGDHYSFHIKQQPGEDAEQLAQRIMEKIEREKAKRRRGSYEDDE